ncbi:MAG: FISUMP domain-containing protein, partial [Bacteroidetes bacterium]|nr:FISUMP domain-containing protein [Bacteroidota bacterium]
GESVAGGQMKTTYGWNNGGNGTNASGFSGLPGGSRYSNGDFLNAGYFGYWWSSSPGGTGAWGRSLYYDYENVTRYYDFQRNGFCVRCVRDAE